MLNNQIVKRRGSPGFYVYMHPNIFVFPIVKTQRKGKGNADELLIMHRDFMRCA